MDARKQEWLTVHQPFELDYHKWRGVEWCSNEEQFQDFWREIENWIDPPAYVLDIGCGPRPPFAPCTVIEPLAYKYQKIAPLAWWQMVTVYGGPAEAHHPELDGQFPLVVCWNCLDHTYDWRAILDNVVRYLAPGGRFALATDFREPSIGHPGYPREEFLTEIQERFEVVKTREHFKERDLCMVLKARG